MNTFFKVIGFPLRLVILMPILFMVLLAGMIRPSKVGDTVSDSVDFLMGRR
jgi:hypothetical protein